MRISDWSSDVCSSDLLLRYGGRSAKQVHEQPREPRKVADQGHVAFGALFAWRGALYAQHIPEGVGYGKVIVHARYALHGFAVSFGQASAVHMLEHAGIRSEEHTSELQSLMRISYAVFCLKKKKLTLNDSAFLIQTQTEDSTQQHYR